MKKVWFKEGKVDVCYACEPPYKKENIIHEGVPSEIWKKLETFNNEN